MAKKAMINKELRREKLAAAGKYPTVRLHNRCSICGRPHGFHRDFGLCRICLRKMAHQGLLPGVTKASWQFSLLHWRLEWLCIAKAERAVYAIC